MEENQTENKEKKKTDSWVVFMSILAVLALLVGILIGTTIQQHKDQPERKDFSAVVYSTYETNQFTCFYNDKLNNSIQLCLVIVNDTNAVLTACEGNDCDEISSFAVE